jgi:pyridoxal 5'-phosphate synthase pdxS subunit
MIRTKGEAGTGNVVEAVRHQRTILRQIGELQAARPEQHVTIAKELGSPVELVRDVAALGRLPVVNFAAGGLATPADAALMMQLGVDGVFVGSGIFKSEDPAPRARAIVEATTHFNDPDVLAKVSRGLGDPMPGLDIKELGEEGLLQTRGW